MATKKLAVLSLVFFIAAGVLASIASADRWGPGWGERSGYVKIISDPGEKLVQGICLPFFPFEDNFRRKPCSKLLTCPTECPDPSTKGIGKKACFFDCSPRCITTCKHRKPKCTGFGSLCYDPRLVGGDGSMFYFHGEKNQDFCLVSDRSVHINGHFIGLRPEGRSRDYTWVQALGVLFGPHKLSIGAKKVAQWDDKVDQLLFSYDGLPFAVEEEAGAMWRSENGLLTVERTYQQNVVEVVLDKMLSILIQVVPITQKEDKAHNYQLPSDDVFAHFDLQFKFYNLSESVNGVLGQTYQPGYVSPAKVGVKMPVLGGEDRFLTTGLLNSDCKESQFTPEFLVGENVQTLLQVDTQCSSEGSDTGLVCRR